jgi:rhodanese-related sulfurtransferase
MRWITPRELQNLQNSESNVLIIDIRETYETQICQIASMHIPMAEIKTRFSEIPKDKSLVIMCKSGKRAEATANYMECELGFENLSILEGGILNWIAEIDTHLETY